MRLLFLFLIIFKIQILSIKCDKEYIDPYYLQSNENDQINIQNVINKKASAERLWKLFKSHIDQNSNLNKTQLYNYIENRIKEIHENEIINEIKIYNHQENAAENKIEFKIYFEKIYGIDNLIEFTQRTHEEKINSNMDELEILFKVELNRWNYILNKNKILPVDKKTILNSKLTKKQFYSFIYLNEFDFIRLNDAKFVFDFYDLNNDSLIDFDEFLNAIKKNKAFLLIDEYNEVMNHKKKIFSSKIDTNGDNKIDLGEFCDWNIQSMSQIVKKQTNEIFENCDLNKNDFLEKNEVIKNYEFFKMYEFTNFGNDFIVDLNHDEL